MHQRQAECPICNRLVLAQRRSTTVGCGDLVLFLGSLLMVGYEPRLGFTMLAFWALLRLWYGMEPYRCTRCGAHC